MKTFENRDAWTEQRVQRLKALWADGLSCSAIARDLGGTTRNAVIGKVCRLGLPHRKLSDNSHKRPYPKRSATKFNFSEGRSKGRDPLDAVTREPFVSRETVVTPPERRVPLEALDDSKCKYPHGDAPPYMFCGEKAALGLSWCRTHAKAIFPSLRAKYEAEEAAEASASLGKLEGTGGFQPSENSRELEGVA